LSSSALVDEDTSPTQNSAISTGGTAGSNAAGTWTQGESVVVQLTRPLLFEGERVTVQIVDSETNSLVMDRTVRIQDTKRFQFSPDGGATIVDGTAPDGNVSINDSVNVSDGTLGDLPDVSTDPGDGGGTPNDPSDGTPASDPDVGSGDGDDEPQPKSDVNCSFTGQTATGGIACAGDQTGSNDDSSTGGYTKVCDSGDINCAPAGSSGSPGSVPGDDENGLTDTNPGFLDVGSGGGSGGGGGGSSGGNGDSGAIGPGM